MNNTTKTPQTTLSQIEVALEIVSNMELEAEASGNEDEAWGMRQARVHLTYAAEQLGLLLVRGDH